MQKKWCLIGMPDEKGVKNVGGRIGAAKGPEAFREHFLKPRGRYDILSLMENFGDAAIAESIEETHSGIAKMLRGKLLDFDFSILVGGGHDLAYPHLKGVADAFHLEPEELGCINIDPHFDLRKDEPVITSGSPFRLATKYNIIKGENLIEFGIQDHCNAAELFFYAENHKIQIITFDKLSHGKAVPAFEKSLKKLASKTKRIVISLDMDALQAAYAPGVSAPAANGFNPSEIIDMIKIAAHEEKVVSIGIYELNPTYDIDGRTAFLAAIIAWYFAAERLFCAKK